MLSDTRLPDGVPSLRLPLAAVVVAYGMLAFITGIGLQLVVFLPLENGGLPYSQSVWFYGAYGLVAALANIGCAFPLDRVPALRVAMGAFLVNGCARALLLWPVVAASPNALFLILGVVMPILDAVASLALFLAIRRLIDVAHPHEAERKSARRLRAA